MACSKAHLYDPALKENQDPVLMKLQSQVKKVVFKLPELGAEHAGLPSQDFEAADVARILYRAGRADPCLQYETEADQLLLLMHLILKHFADSGHIEVVKQVLVAGPYLEPLLMECMALNNFEKFWKHVLVSCMP
jgi:hypothetical protein